MRLVGWKFVDGKAVDLPNVPPGVRHHETVRIKTYPTKEFGQIVSHMGPKAENMPEVPNGIRLDAGAQCVMKQMLECNWAQARRRSRHIAFFVSAYAAPHIQTTENRDANFQRP